MKALYKTNSGVGNIGVAERPLPELDTTNNVLVKVEAVGICGMDNHIYQGQMEVKHPLILGHEFVGSVEETLGAQYFKKGDRVVCEPHLYSCGVCQTCINGAPQLCQARKTIGIDRDGAMAEFIAVPERNLHHIPNNMPPEIACLVEPATIVFTDLIMRAHLIPGDNIAIWGAGIMGMLSLVWSQISGADHIAVVGTDKDEQMRANLISNLGAKFINTKANVIDELHEYYLGEKADLSVECSGSTQAILQSLEVLRINGTACCLGLNRENSISLNWDKRLWGMNKIVFNMMCDYQQIDRVIRLVYKYQKLFAQIVTIYAGLDKYEKAFADIAEYKAVKAIICV